MLKPELPGFLDPEVPIPELMNLHQSTRERRVDNGVLLRKEKTLSILLKPRVNSGSSKGENRFGCLSSLLFCLAHIYSKLSEASGAFTGFDTIIITCFRGNRI